MHGSFAEPRADNRAHPFFSVRQHGQGRLRPEPLASEQRAYPWFRQGIEIAHDGECLAGAPSRASMRLLSTSKCRRPVVRFALTGPIDAELQLIHGRQRRDVLGDIATQLGIDGAADRQRPIPRRHVIESAAAREKLPQQCRGLPIGESRA